MNRMKTILLLLLMLVGWSTWCQSGRVKVVTDEYDNSHSGSPATTKQAMLDSLAGFQSFADLNSIAAANPRLGYTLENRSSGARFRVVGDTIADLTIDGDYQIALSGGKYLIREDEAHLTFTDRAVSDVITQRIAQRTRDNHFELVLTDTVSANRAFVLPNPAQVPPGVLFSISADYADTEFSYYLQPTDSVSLSLVVNEQLRRRYYLDNGETVTLWVVNGKWHLWKKRVVPFINGLKDWQKHRFELGDIVYFGKNRTPYKIVPGTYANHQDGTEVNDSVFVIPVKEKAPLPINLFYNNEQLIRTAGDGLNTWAIENADFDVFNNYAPGPSGVKNASLIISKVDGLKNIVQNNLPTDLEVGDTMYISFWAKALSANDTTEIRLRYDPGTNNINPVTVPAGTLTTKWQQFSEVIEIEDDPNNALTFRFRITNSVGDSILFAEPYLTPGPQAGPYIRTTDIYRYGSNDMVYAVPANLPQPQTDDLVARFDSREDVFFPNRKLNIDEYEFPESVSSTSVSKWRYAINICKNNQYCDGIEFAAPYTLQDTLLVPEHFTIEGVGSGAILYADLRDTAQTRSLLFCEGSSSYASGQSLRNFTIEALSPAFAGINMNNAASQRHANITIQGNDKLVHGVHIGRATGLSAVGTFLDQVNVFECETGIYYENCGNNHTLLRCKSHRHQIGVGGTASLLSIIDCGFESSDTTLKLVAPDGVDNVYVSNSYFEDGEIYLKDLSQFTFHYSRTSGGPFYLVNTKMVAINASRLANNSVPQIVGGLPERFEVRNTFFERIRDLQRLRNIYKMTNRFEEYNNFAEDEEVYSNPVGYLNRISSRHSELANASLLDTTKVSGRIEAGRLAIVPKEQNLVANSDSIGIADGSYTNYDIENNIIEAPDGTLTADRYLSTARNVSSISLANRSLAKNIVAGSPVTFTVFAKDLKQAGRSTTRVLARFVPGEIYDLGEVGSKDWTLLRVTIDSVDATNNALSVRLTNTTEGDSLAFWGWQLVKGRERMTYVPTGDTGIDNDSIFHVNVDGELAVKADSFKLEGPLKVSAEQILSSYGQSNKTAAQLSKTYSGWQAAYANDGTLIELPNNWGTTTGTTDAGGDIIITHGLSSGGAGIAPDNVKITNLDLTSNLTFIPHSIGPSAFSVRVKDASTGAAVSSASVNFMWEAKAKAE